MNTKRVNKALFVLLFITVAAFLTMLATFYFRQDTAEADFVALKNQQQTAPAVTTAAKVEARKDLPVAKIRPKEKLTILAKPLIARDLPNLHELDICDAFGLDESLLTGSVRYVEETQQIPLTHGSYEQKTADLYIGERQIAQQGVDGLMVVRNSVKYVNDKRESVREVGRTVLQQAVDEVVLVGTTPRPVATTVAETTAQATTAASASPESAATTADPQASTSAGGTVPSALAATAPTTAPALRSGGELLQDVNWSPAGSAHAAQANLEILQSLNLIYNSGYTNYDSFQDNGDGTLTVNGMTFAYSSVSDRPVTCYDGLECCIAAGDHNPPQNHATASGIMAQRGLCAAAPNGLPFGTVLFVEGYGFAVVADRHGVADYYPDLIDVCYNPGEISQGLNFGRITAKVYIIKTPGE